MVEGLRGGVDVVAGRGIEGISEAAAKHMGMKMPTEDILTPVGEELLYIPGGKSLPAAVAEERLFRFGCIKCVDVAHEHLVHIRGHIPCVFRAALANIDEFTLLSIHALNVAYIERSNLRHANAGIIDQGDDAAISEICRECGAIPMNPLGFKEQMNLVPGHRGLVALLVLLGGADFQHGILAIQNAANLRPFVEAAKSGQPVGGSRGIPVGMCGHEVGHIPGLSGGQRPVVARQMVGKEGKRTAVVIDARFGELHGSAVLKIRLDVLIHKYPSISIKRFSVQKTERFHEIFSEIFKEAVLKSASVANCGAWLMAF